MIKNYFFLNRFVTDADTELKGFSLLSAFSQEKDKLIFTLGRTGTPIPLLDESATRFIEISVNNAFPFIAFRKKYARAKRNTVDFFEDLLPSPVESVGIKRYDRVIEIKCSTFSIFYMIRGKFTNIVLISAEGEIIPFKKNEGENYETLKEELEGSQFGSEYSYPDFQFNDLDELKKKYPFTGKEILLELKVRNEETTPDKLINLLNETASANPAVYYYKQTGEYEILFDNFTSKGNTEVKSFDTTSEAVYYFISRKYSTDEIKDKKNRVRKHVEKQLEKLSAKLNNISNLLNEGSKEALYNEYGNVLLININEIKPGLDKVKVFNIYKEKVEEIKLDPSLHPRKNIDRYFEKARDEKTRIEKGKELKLKLEKDYTRFQAIRNKLEASDLREDLISIMKELKMKDTDSPGSNDEDKYNFKRYLIEGKYHVFVGRDSRNNDELTTRFAKQNDYWFHARGLPGSHVILRSDNTKEVIPKNIIKKAAALAAYHSKGKTAGLMPVSYTQKKYVVKKKGMEPGKVALMKEEVVLVKPEIPPDCEFIT